LFFILQLQLLSASFSYLLLVVSTAYKGTAFSGHLLGQVIVKSLNIGDEPNRAAAKGAPPADRPTGYLQQRPTI
jgi:hypothetical protein